MIRQGETKGRLHVRRYYFNFDASFGRYRYRGTQQSQYPRFYFSDVVKNYRRCALERLTGQNTPHRVSVNLYAFYDWSFGKIPLECDAQLTSSLQIPIGLPRSSYFLWRRTVVASVDDSLQYTQAFTKHCEKWMMRNNTQRRQRMISHFL